MDLSFQEPWTELRILAPIGTLPFPNFACAGGYLDCHFLLTGAPSACQGRRVNLVDVPFKSPHFVFLVGNHAINPQPVNTMLRTGWRSESLSEPGAG